jgi:hypothetical protein
MAHFTADFTMADIDKDFKNMLAGIQEDIIEALKGTLIEMVDKARRKTKVDMGFANITWNLRESIGGIVVNEDQIVFTYFPLIGKGPEGRKKGIAYAQELALLQQDSHQLMVIFVAGEEYAKFVETKGWDVITGSSWVFDDHFASLLKQIKAR